MSNDDINDDSTEDNSFVMPEDDGIHSGQPIDDIDNDELAPEASTIRKKNARFTKQQHQQNSDTHSSTQIGAWTIKKKLLGSFTALTLLIAFLGYYGYTTLLELSSISSVVATEQSQVSKLAEEVKASVYKIRDAEKDFTYLEEQESLDRVTRYTAYIREQLKDINLIAEKLEKSTGIAASSEFKMISELVDNYESQFSNQVISIKKARLELDDDLTEISAFKNRLLSEIDKILTITENLASDFWINTKQQMALNARQLSATATATATTITDAQNASNNIELVAVGVLISQLQQVILNVQIQTAKYFDTNKQSFAESSRVFVNKAISLSKEIRTRTINERVAQQVDTIATNLTTYTSIFNEVTNSNETVLQNKVIIDLKIKDQLDKLKTTSDKLLSTSELVTVNSWGQMKVMSNKLGELSTSAQQNLALLAILGTLIGLIVLIWIPRPILNGINLILAAAQQVAAGDLTQAVNVSSRDELGQLANTFERMRINLQALVIRSQNASVQITSAVNEIQAAANQQSATANEQAASINQFRATLGEMARTAGELSSVVNEINTYAEKVSDHVRLSNDKSTQLLDSMGLINDSTQQTSGRIKSLNDQMDSINDAVNIISVVADQTTLLSMNASIEANKAGEMGKGFSVVAYEIRRLSDRAIDSAGDITGKVRDIQRATENSVVAMDKSSEEIRTGITRVQESTSTLASINDSLNSIRSQIGDIATGTQEQSQASNQAQQSVGELAESSKMVSVSAKQTVAAAFEINAMANQLAESVASFRT